MTVYTWVRQHRAAFDVRTMCRVLGVSRAAFYAWLKGPAARPRERYRRELAAQIGRIRRERYLRTYGSPRMTRELVARGTAVSENTVAKVMRAAGLRAGPGRRFVPRTTDARHGRPVAPNRLDRDFAADAPDRKWVADITCIPTRQGWLYLAGVLDCFSRRIVGWSMDTTMRATLACDALDMAVARRRPGVGVIHHGDRGSQYAADAYQSRLRRHGMICSMSRAGDCYDNAMKESFWSTLKREAIGGTVFDTIDQARVAVFEYIEVFYNRKRRHSSLGYVSPETFEAALN